MRAPNRLDFRPGAPAGVFVVMEKTGSPVLDSSSSARRTGKCDLPAPFSLRVYIGSGVIMAAATYGIYQAQRLIGTHLFKPILAGLIATALVFLGPLAALSVYFGTTFFGALTIPGVPFSANQAVGIIALAAWGLWLVAGRLTWPRGGLVWFLAAISVYYVLNAALGQSEKYAMISVRYVVLCEVMAFVLLTSLRRPAHWNLWLWLVVLLSSAIALIGFVEFLTGMDFYPQGRWGVVTMRQNRIDGVSQNAIMFSYNNLWAAGLGMYLALESPRKWHRACAAGVTALLLVTALLTLNRQTPFIMLLMFAAALALFRHQMVRPLTIAFFIVGLLLSPFLAAEFGKRFQETGRLTHDPSYALRRDKTLVMKEMIRQNPWFGIGIGAFPEVWPRYLAEDLWFLQNVKPRVHYPDLGYFQMLSETGLVGFGLQALLVGVLAFRLWKRRRRALETGSRAVANLCAALLVLLVHFLVAQLMQDIFFFSRTWWLFAMMIVAVARRDGELVAMAPTLPASPASLSSPEANSSSP